MFVARRYGLYGIVCLLLALSNIVHARTAVALVADLPDTVDTAYDVTWELQIEHPTSAATVLALDQGAHQAYILTLTNKHASWRSALPMVSVSPVIVPLHLQPHHSYAVTFKRREGTVALLIDHRLVLAAEAPMSNGESLHFHPLSAGMSVLKPRYQPRETMRGLSYFTPLSKARIYLTESVSATCWAPMALRPCCPAASLR